MVNKEWVSFFRVHVGMTPSADKATHVNREVIIGRFVCSAFRIIPPWTQKKALIPYVDNTSDSDSIGFLINSIITPMTSCFSQNTENYSYTPVNKVVGVYTGSILIGGYLCYRPCKTPINFSNWWENKAIPHMLQSYLLQSHFLFRYWKGHPYICVQPSSARVIEVQRSKSWYIA